MSFRFTAGEEAKVNMKTLALFAIIVASGRAWAQDYPRLELSAGYSYGSVDTQGYGNQRDAQGWSGSVAANLKKWVGAEAEVSSRFNALSFDYQGNSLTVNSRYYTFLFGPRFAYRTGKVTPFVHGLFGLDRSPAFVNTVYDPLTGTSVSPYSNGLAAVAGGGFDYAISRRLAFRSQADYLFRRSSTLTPTPNNFRVMAAIVFTFGQTESLQARRHTDTPVMAQSPSSPQPTSIQQQAETGSNTVRYSPVENTQTVEPSVEGAKLPVEPRTSMPQTSAASPVLRATVEPSVIKETAPVVSRSAPAQTVASASLEASPHSIVISQPIQSQTTSPQQESLGEVARRYRAQKRENVQN
jgi:hypothetical protein